MVFLWFAVMRGSALVEIGPNRVVGEFAGVRARTAVILLHPHPMLGGDMDNNVVDALFTRMQETNQVSVLRINFRPSWIGNSARSDVRDAIDFVTKHDQFPAQQVVLVGYSFGAAVGTYSASSDDRVCAFCGISPPFGMLSWVLLGHHFKSLNKPSLHILGTLDQFTSVSQLDALLRRHQDKTKVIVPQVDHFWFQHEELLVEHVEKWLQARL